MNKLYVDGCYEARGPIAAYCVVCVIKGSEPTWRIIVVPPEQAHDVELVGLKEAIKCAHQIANQNLEETAVYSDSVYAIKRCSEWAKRLSIELKHVPGHLAGKVDVEITDDVKKHHWADVQARNCVQKMASELQDSGNRIKGLDKLFNMSDNVGVKESKK